MEIPKIKFIVKVWPNNTADAMPVKMVATVDEYFFKIVSANIIMHESDIYTSNYNSVRYLNSKGFEAIDMATTGRQMKKLKRLQWPYFTCIFEEKR